MSVDNNNEMTRILKSRVVRPMNKFVLTLGYQQRMTSIYSLLNAILLMDGQ